MKTWKDYYRCDLSRYGDVKVDCVLKKLLKRYRKCQFAKSKLLSAFYRLSFRRVKRKLNIEIFGKTKIGPGLYIGHANGIIVNSEAILGKNCNIHRGVVIGQENRGKRKGVPTIGNNVWIGINAVVVGKITIGDDVMIAPNSFVNCDIPSHSIVFGNPCVIKHRENATELYINNLI